MAMCVAGHGEGHANASAGGIPTDAPGMPGCLEHIISSCVHPSAEAVL